MCSSGFGKMERISSCVIYPLFLAEATMSEIKSIFFSGFWFFLGFAAAFLAVFAIIFTSSVRTLGLYFNTNGPLLVATRVEEALQVRKIFSAKLLLPTYSSLLLSFLQDSPSPF